MISKWFKSQSNKTEMSSLLLLIVIIVVNAILQNGFFSLRVFNSNVSTFCPIILVSMAQGVILLCGELDLSVGAAVSVINCILGAMMNHSAGLDALALVLTFAVALLMGAANGFLVGYLKLPSMIATFATSAVWSGIALLIMPRPGGSISAWATNLFGFQALILSTPLLIILAALLIWLYIKRRKIGKYIYAVGSDEKSAFANGVQVARIRMASFIIAYFFIFLAAVAISFQTSSSDPTIGASYTLTSIAAAVIGGISMLGGKGHVIGAVIGALIMEFIINVIYFANIPSTFQQFVSGVIVIIALSSATLYKLNSRKLSQQR